MKYKQRLQGFSLSSVERFRLWLMAAMALLLLSPAQVMAEVHQCVFHNKNNWTVRLSGTNNVKLRFPVRGHDHDMWADKDSKLWYTLPGQSKKTLIQMNSDPGTPSPWASFWYQFTWDCTYDHKIVLRREGMEDVTYTSNQKLNVPRSSDDGCWVEIEFQVPMSWCGKHVDFEWEVYSSYDKSKKLPMLPWSVDIPDAPEGMDPELAQPVLSPRDIGKIGYMWYVSAQEVTKAQAKWKPSADATTEVTEELEAAMSGTVQLNATEPHYGFHVVADYIDTYNYTVAGRSTELVDVPMLHAPLNFRAVPIDNGKGYMKLTWETNYKGYPDISENDFFEIQRSLTGQEADFKTITTEMYDESVTQYEYIDETLLTDAKSSEELENAVYRIRRSSSAIWGWDLNPTVATTKPATTIMALYKPTGAAASWLDESAHTLQVKWDYLPSILTAPTPTTPAMPRAWTGKGEGTWENPYSIASTEEWDEFAGLINQVNSPYADKYYRLDADISVKTIVGENEPRAFKGVFDGNGHTITVNISRIMYQGTALFSYISDATIQNLKVAGRVTGDNHCAALVGFAWSGTNTIKNCIVTARVECDGYTSSHCGGILGHGKSSNTTIADCAFTGTITGPTTATGIIYGWHDAGGTHSIVNCLSAGTYTGCNGLDLIKHAEGSDNITNCYRKTAGGSQGTDASNMSDDSLQQALGSAWTTADGVTPILTTVYALPGTGTEADPFCIDSSKDWATLADMVESRNSLYGGKYFKLTSDITVNEMIGTEEIPFSGIFDGDGHTITANIIETSDEGTALFRYISNTTIQNLRVAGTVTGGKHCAAIVGFAWSGTNTIKSCIVTALVECNSSDLSRSGGILGHGKSSNTTITDCAFYGTITGSATSTGIIYGWHDAGGTHSIVNCLSAGTYTGCGGVDLIKKYAGEDIITNCYRKTDGGSQGTDASQMTNEELKNKLGSEWTIRNDMVVPTVVATDIVYAWDNRALMTLRVNKYNRDNQLIATVDYPVSAAEVQARSKELPLSQSCISLNMELLVNRGTSPLYAAADSVRYDVTEPASRFYFEGSGKVSKTIVAETRQSSVVLTWDIDGDVVDFFQVLRKQKGETDDKYTVVRDTLQSMSWEDTTVLPLETYIYKVRSAVDCEGLSFNESDPVQGECKHTGMVEGYVRYPDGTGVAGMEINIAGGGKTFVGQTNDEGYFMVDGLPYNGQSAITYDVTPVSRNQIALDVATMPVEFNSVTNHSVLRAFVVQNANNFSGFVMYEGTSIPVKGANFLLNGHTVMRGGKPLETDFEGKFNFYVPNGTDTIQAVMAGHQFTNDGYFKSPDGYNFQGDVEKIYFYDETKVKLIGRIVGGDTQGNLPLDNSLSSNNLGEGVKMVLTLEGDNTSWLVYDNLNPEKSTIDYTVSQANPAHFTTVHTTRKRMEVSPDLKTGEYTLMLPPVRWKVQQVYSKGYATLFQEGQVSEVIDLTDCLETKSETIEGKFANCDGDTITNPVVTYNAQYSRIYHTPVELTYQQQTYDQFDYLGDKTYKYRQVDGTRLSIPLAEADPTAAGGVRYTFGYPVYSLNMQYPTKLAAVERYYWNNDENTGRVDVVQVGGGTVTVQNDMLLTNQRQEVQLDENGEAMVNIMAQELPMLLTGTDALRTVTMTLTQDGTTYEAKPIRAYVLNVMQTGSAKDVITCEVPQVLDILRDPPGANSYATLERGSRLSSAYSMDMSLEAGTTFGMEVGKALDNYWGVVAGLPAGTETGVLNSTSNTTLFDFDITYRMKVGVDASYTATLTHDISTSSDPTMVGAPADLYLGTLTDMVVTKGSTIRAIPDSVYQQIRGRAAGTASVVGLRLYGSLVDIAQGTDEKGNLYHLVRDESLIAGHKVKSSFVYSQQHILNTIIPQLIEHSRSMMFYGTEEEAQAKADATGQLVYRSLVPPEYEYFGVGNPVFYKNGDPKREDCTYVIHVPKTGQVEELRDSVAGNWNIITGWLQMIGINEMQKITAIDRLANYSIDGGGEVTYSEEFNTRIYSAAHSQNPFMIGTEVLGDDMLAALGVANGIAIPVAKLISKLFTLVNQSVDYEENSDKINASIKFTGTTIKFNFEPIFDFDLTDWSKDEKAYSRKETFHIKMNPKSHLSVDVMRVQPLIAMALEQAKAQGGTEESDASSLDYYDLSTSILYFGVTEAGKQVLDMGVDVNDLKAASAFVYRTRGGATAQPWEDARYSMLYNAGTLLDERTKKIENPKVKLDKQSISGVNPGEPARFKVFLANESEEPEVATIGELTYYNLFVKDNSNPNGAKIYIDGMPLNGEGVIVKLEPGTVTQKVMEVYAGEGFDYEGITLAIKSRHNYGENIQDEVSFDVHFLRGAGNVDIASPADKWIMNTDAQYDEERGYFIPVIISNFDKHQKNFDHIELQYKESTRGEDFWTNLCSYYADSTLMAKASGQKEMIPENGNITAHFYGEGVVMEKGYDLRAVLYCRDGNNFLTSSSKVMSGIKDTRRPQLFGSPEPISGILGAGQNVVFNFSEDIEYNYLSDITNFEVKGEVNNDNLTTDVSLQFSGQGSLETEATRNFADKDITVDIIVRPDQSNAEMPLFSHGSDGKKLQLWITPEGKLKAVVNDKAYTTNEAIDTRTFQQVAMVLHQPTADKANGYVEFYNGGHLMGSYDLSEAYSGTGNVVFGSTNEPSANARTYYKGRMMEARLWYRALTGGLLNSSNYGFKRLTGYEMGLMDYWPMDEGSGNYVADKAQGAHIQMGKGVAWAVPGGMSLKLTDSDRGFALVPEALSRTAEQDYTLMFWFRNAKSEGGAMVANGSGMADEDGAENKFFVGFEGTELKYRTNGIVVDIPGEWADGNWHHYAMTMNRSMNVMNFYVDQTLRASIEPESIGGISGGLPMLGSMSWIENGSIHASGNNFTGNIDEVCLFDQALPLTLLQSFSTHSPQGDEAGLRTYLGFQRQERQGDNDIEVTPYAYSKKIYVDNGQIRYQLDPETQESTGIPVRDYLFEDSEQTILGHIDQTVGAPVLPDQAMHNLNASFVGRDHSLLMNLLTTDDKVNKRNIYVTVRDVPDKNGNAMASPVTATFFVDRNPLRWKVKNMKIEQDYGTATTFDVDIQNNSAAHHTYTVENNPRWLTVSPAENSIGATEEQTLTFTVSKDLNVGKYDEIIYLIDEDGLAEPLMVTIDVSAEAPQWTQGVDRKLRQYSMNITARVVLNNEIATDADDVVGVFDEKDVCHGVSNISYDELTGESFVYITVYNDSTRGGDLTFRLWNSSIGKEQVLIPQDTENGGEAQVTFLSSRVIGSPASPLILKGGDIYLQNVKLYEGWNWVSINVLPDYVKSYQSLLNRMPMSDGDMVTDNQSGNVYVYNAGRWMASGTDSQVKVNHKTTYFVKVQKDADLMVYGTIIKNDDDRTIPLVHGWNTIGYTPMLNLTVETALADYHNKAQDGDVIKSHDEYAVFTVTNGVGRWKGSLKYMKPGEGYMLQRKADEPAVFTYPFFEPTSTFMDEVKDSPVHFAPQRSTMSLTATVTGLETLPGDKLIGYTGAEMRGQVMSNEEGLFYLSVGGDVDAPLWFAIERDGNIIATTGEVMKYASNAVVGTPNEPAAVQFVTIDSMADGWYTVGGVKLDAKPVKAGVYIHNGKKETVK